MSAQQGRDALAALLRWEAAGGTWVQRGRSGGALVVDLVTCDGGEVVGELRSPDPAFVAHVLGGSDRGR